MSDTEDKRSIPPILRKILDTDVLLTKRFVSYILNFVAIRSLRRQCKFLEYSCHGIVWLSSWLAFCWTLNNPDLYQMQINMFLGLMLDIIFLVILKSLTRRRRPVTDGNVLMGPDKFSFPSGHASRAFFIAFFFTTLYPLSLIFWPPLFMWAASVALSRLLLYRHHILDIVGGIFLAVFETLLMSCIWLNKDISHWTMAWISDENLPGNAETQEDVF